jgi:RNA polymerase sigma factor (sigma-70 family)
MPPERGEGQDWGPVVSTERVVGTSPEQMPAPTRLPEGFDASFDALFARAYRVARRILGDSAAAEDVAAEAMARAYAHWAKIADQPWREGWVVRVASNLALDVVRKEARVSNVEIERVVEDDDVAVRVTLSEALSRLPRRQREVVVLRHLGGLSEAECADALSVSTGAVKTHLHRGLAALRVRLGPVMSAEGVSANG